LCRTPAKAYDQYYAIDKVFSSKRLWDDIGVCVARPNPADLA
jgi:hypothetical protein